MQPIVYCVLISLSAMLCLCEKWSEIHIREAPGCLETVMDVTDWYVPDFNVISDGTVQMDDRIFDRHPNFAWRIYSSMKNFRSNTRNIILFVNDFKSLEAILNEIHFERLDNRVKLVIKVKENFSSLAGIRKGSANIPHAMWRWGVMRTVYLVPCKTNILAMTHFPFARNCQIGGLEILDIWNGKYFEKGVELFPEMMLNIRGCVQNYSAAFDGRLQTTIHVRKEFTKSGEMIVGGVGGKLMTIVAEKMNMKLQLLEDPPKFDDYFLKPVLMRRSIFALDALPAHQGLNHVFHQDIVYMEESYGLGYLNDGLEISWKNFLWPLSAEAWMYIGLTTVSYCGLIFLINLSHRSKITSDKFGIFESFGFFLGNGRVLPKTYFGRYVIGMWVVYSLLMNAAYIGGLISCLTTPVEGRLINTIDELLADGMEFGGYSWHRRFFDDPFDPKSKEVYDNFKSWDLDEQRRRLFDGRGATSITASSVYLHNHCGNSSSRLHMLKEKASTFQLPIYILRGSPFAIGLRRYTSQAIESGFRDYWFKYYTRNRSSARIRTDGPIPISLQHIEGIFYLYIVGVFVCCVVFLGELLLHRYSLSCDSSNFIWRQPS